MKEDGVYFRKQNGLSGTVICSLDRGTVVNFTPENQYPYFVDGHIWSRVEYRGQIGWIASEYLENAVTERQSGVQYIVNAGALNVREWPSTYAKKTDTLTINARVTTLGEECVNEGYTWAKVRVNATGKQGWVAKQYLKKPLNSNGYVSVSDFLLNTPPAPQPAPGLDTELTDTPSTWSPSAWLTARIEHYRNVLNTAGATFTDATRQDDFVRGVFTSAIIDVSDFGTTLLQALIDASQVFQPYLPTVDFYNKNLKTDEAFDQYSLGLSTYADSYYLGRMAGDIIVEAIATGATIASVAEIIGGGAATIGGAATAETGVGAAVAALGTAAVASGVATTAVGATVVATAAQNYGKNSDRFDSYFKNLECSGDGQTKRGVGGKGWRGDKAWRQNVDKVRQGGTIEDFDGIIPTEQEAIDLINEAGGTYLRTEGPHMAPNPHRFKHINYHTATGVKGTIRIK